MKLLLDTSGYAALMRGDHDVLDVLNGALCVLVPTVVLGELHSGFRQGGRTQENQRQLITFLADSSVSVVPITAETALHYAEIDVYLHAKGRPIPRNDVWIAASALEHGAALVTRDGHFRELPLLLIRP